MTANSGIKTYATVPCPPSSVVDCRCSWIGFRLLSGFASTLRRVFHLFGYITLHMFMYTANIYFWRRYRVHYPFIFCFKEGTELGFREVLLLSCCVAVLSTAAGLANLDMEMDPKTLDYKAITELVPLGLLVLLLVILLCPLNIIYRSSRFFLLGCLFHCLCAPLYKLTLPDFFLADQLTSQVQAFRSLEFYICYYGWGDYKKIHNTCLGSDVYKASFFIVAAVPYWIRLLQIAGLTSSLVKKEDCLDEGQKTIESEEFQSNGT